MASSKLSPDEIADLHERFKSCNSGFAAPTGLRKPRAENLPTLDGHPTSSWGYRGWTIAKEPDGRWHGTSDNYDASYEGPEDGGWVDNGEKVDGATLSDACDEIDAFIEEGEEAERAYEAQDAE